MKNKIEQKRKEYDLTQRELALRVNITETQIRNIEKNRSIPRVDIAMKIAKELKSTVEEIFNYD
ncbi:helix-turn-helix transcriptional regulator [Clostridium beijerinckii]|uniref:helix-turn-helix transcriptional regulator n=1 Tax=Clostridium beijerinckii TaxID=1520 RepID=UPI001494A85C|nr:helix-turn-helix domain-containing protein [Clostridium beijerinckii]NOW08110.1 putative transcriptional regulator [Clostridium beijerinckii]CAI9912337.1 Transcriptional regulator [Clostridium phage CAK1]